MDLSPTGLEKGNYAVPSGPWVSDDDSIAVVSGNVTGWCHFKKFSNSTIWNYTGNLSVTDFDGEFVQIIKPPPSEDSEPQSCDNPETDIVEDECEEPGTHVVTGGTGQTGEYIGEGGMYTWKVVCQFTDWYESGNGGATWQYTDTTLDYCWVE